MEGENYYQFVFIILLYIIGAIINRVIKGRQDLEMKELGSALSLEYIEGGMMRRPRLAGIYQGREVMVENIVHSRGREQKPFFRVVMHTNVSLTDSIRVHNALSFGPVTGLFAEIGELLGVHDIHFDNSVFDEKFVIRGRNEHLVKAVLDPSVQEALINIGRVNLVIQNDEIIYEDEGHAPENESRIRLILTFEDTIAARISEVTAKGYVEEEGVEEAIVGFKPKPRPEAALPEFAQPEAASRPQVTVDMGRVYKVAHSDIVAPRSDYFPQVITPDQLINQLKNEGYYSGD